MLRLIVCTCTFKAETLIKEQRLVSVPPAAEASAAAFAVQQLCTIGGSFARHELFIYRYMVYPTTTTKYVYVVP